jgi:hypothetical protein
MEATSTSNLTKKLDAVNEFERTPVPENKLKGAASFWGMYAGEHTSPEPNLSSGRYSWRTELPPATWLPVCWSEIFWQC